MTKAELARFLMHLADLYSDAKTGNRALSDGLRDLVEQIVQPTAAANRASVQHKKNIVKSASRPTQNKSEGVQAEFAWLRSLDTEAARAFVSDATKTKTELLQLASERFSIPRARLMKIGTASVREEIKSAILHEESLRMISQEAERSGSERNS